MIIQPLNIAIDRMFFISHSNINQSFNHHIFLLNHPVLFILLFTYLSVYLLISRVHARKLYLASLFRCFDEADYSPAQDLPYEPTRIHTPRDPIGEIPANQIHGDGRVCYYKNTLRNGLVIAALENRYDHMVRMISIHILTKTMGLCGFLGLCYDVSAEFLPPLYITHENGQNSITSYYQPSTHFTKQQNEVSKFNLTC